MPKIELKDSVGSGGANNGDDVLRVKKRLSELGYPLENKGEVVDSKMIKSIKLFQSIIAGRSTVSGDGRIDVGKTTHQWLEAVNAPKWIRIQGMSGQGWSNTNENSTHEIKYGGGACDWFKGRMDAIGSYYKDKYQKADSKLKPIYINDASPLEGGYTPDHKGHETGLQADIRIPKKDGGYGGITWQSSTYDRVACRKILEAIKAKGNTSECWFNDPVLIKEGLCKSLGGHDNHIHITIKPPTRGSNENPSNVPEKKEESYSYSRLLRRWYSWGNWF